jgi:transposase
VEENQAIIVETLPVKNMLKNRKLARAISDAGGYSLLLKIADKAERVGRHFIKLDRFASTSKTCSCAAATRLPSCRWEDALGRALAAVKSIIEVSMRRATLRALASWS